MKHLLIQLTLNQFHRSKVIIKLKLELSKISDIKVVNDFSIDS